MDVCIGQAPGKEKGMIYKTGDNHGRFERVAQYCDRFGTSSEDGEAFDLKGKQSIVMGGLTVLIR